MLIKEVERSDKGIRLKYERNHQGELEEGYYPKRGEMLPNYCSDVDTLLNSIALELCQLCGLEKDVWNSGGSLSLDKLVFHYIKAENGLNQIAISGKLSGLNDNLGLTQKFSVPKITHDVVIESGLRNQCLSLLEELEAFYHGKTQYQQQSLFNS